MWIEADTYLTIRHFTQDERETLARMVHTIAMKAYRRFNRQADLEDIVSICNMGVLKAYNAFGLKTTVSQCTNYVRSSLRDSFMTEAKLNDIAAQPNKASIEGAAFEIRDAEDQYGYADALDDIKAILNENEFAILLDRINGYSLQEIHLRHNIRCTIKTFRIHVNQIIDKTRAFMIS